MRRTSEMDLMAALADLNYLLKIYQFPVQCIDVICELKSRSAVDLWSDSPVSPSPDERAVYCHNSTKL